jgi:hypothetical protein
MKGRVGHLRGTPKKSFGGDKVADLTNVVTKCEFPVALNREFLKAIDLALAGQWDAAHQIAQQYEDTTAAWIHAVLHKIEGDQDNSRYWYRRAGKMEHFPDEAKVELAEIRKQVAGQV